MEEPPPRHSAAANSCTRSTRPMSCGAPSSPPGSRCSARGGQLTRIPIPKGGLFCPFTRFGHYPIFVHLHTFPQLSHNLQVARRLALGSGIPAFSPNARGLPRSSATPPYSQPTSRTVRSRFFMLFFNIQRSIHMGPNKRSVTAPCGTPDDAYVSFCRLFSTKSFSTLREFILKFCLF